MMPRLELWCGMVSCVGARTWLITCLLTSRTWRGFVRNIWNRSAKNPRYPRLRRQYRLPRLRLPGDQSGPQSKVSSVVAVRISRLPVLRTSRPRLDET
ncbi:hypothetical protein B0T11DRAFT_276092 [Plectosphaerella cucumerina]|uniref:Uncharacterized protein n=1 Tax=Plectosphaerella cucumerina TaxID=40658 RepID=A0A8K0TMG1_9PEZI|nr:hypothetical protein B0T11DRAFT_276092 [Plectosphaerella cucumerina]